MAARAVRQAPSIRPHPPRKIRAYGDTLHSFVSIADYKGPFLPGYQVRRRPAAGVGLQRIDHIVGNVEDGQMNDWGAYYNKVLGLHQFMTFDDKDISTEFSALRSKVMADDKAQSSSPSTSLRRQTQEPDRGISAVQRGRRRAAHRFDHARHHPYGVGAA